MCSVSANHATVANSAAAHRQRHRVSAQHPRSERIPPDSRSEHTQDGVHLSKKLKYPVSRNTQVTGWQGDVNEQCDCQMWLSSQESIQLYSTYHIYTTFSEARVTGFSLHRKSDLHGVGRHTHALQMCRRRMVPPPTSRTAHPRQTHCESTNLQRRMAAAAAL